MIDPRIWDKLKKKIASRGGNTDNRFSELTPPPPNRKFSTGTFPDCGSATLGQVLPAEVRCPGLILYLKVQCPIGRVPFCCLVSAVTLIINLGVGD